MVDTDVSSATQFIRRVCGELVPTIDRATVPFYLVHDEQLKRDRTGVLLRIADAHFILTASHGLREVVENNIPLAVGWNQADGIPVPLHDAQFHGVESHSEAGSKDVVRDIAAVKLTPSTAEKVLAEGKTPITLYDIQLHQDDSNALLLMFGWPSAWFYGFTESGPVSHPLVFACQKYTGEPWPEAKVEFDPDVHALFQFERDALDLNDGDKEVVLPNFTGIQGISGCGIWRAVDWDGDAVARWNPKHFKLAAIQHRYFESAGYIQTTWIRYVIDRIIDDYPELKHATEIVYPS